MIGLPYSSSPTPTNIPLSFSIRSVEKKELVLDLYEARSADGTEVYTWPQIKSLKIGRSGTSKPFDFSFSGIKTLLCQSYALLRDWIAVMPIRQNKISLQSFQRPPQEKKSRMMLFSTFAIYFGC